MAKEDVILNVDGKPVLLRLGFNGLINLEEELGRPISEIADGSISFGDLRAIFYVAIKQGGKKGISLEDTGDILDAVLQEHGMEYLTNAIKELFEKVMGGSGDSFPDTKK